MDIFIIDNYHLEAENFDQIKIPQDFETGFYKNPKRKQQFTNLIKYFKNTQFHYLSYYDLVNRERYNQALNADGIIYSGSPMNIPEAIKNPEVGQFRTDNFQCNKFRRWVCGNALQREKELIMQCQTPQLGICFGHQMIGVAHGNVISKMRQGGEHETINVYYNPKCSLLSNIINPNMIKKDMFPTIAAEESHDYEIKGKIDGNLDSLEENDFLSKVTLNDLEIHGWSNNKCIEIIQSKIKNHSFTYGVQFHPEACFSAVNLNRNDSNLMLLRNFINLIKK